MNSEVLDWPQVNGGSFLSHRGSAGWILLGSSSALSCYPCCHLSDQGPEDGCVLVTGFLSVAPKVSRQRAMGRIYHSVEGRE